MKSPKPLSASNCRSLEPVFALAVGILTAALPVSSEAQESWWEPTFKSERGTAAQPPSPSRESGGARESAWPPYDAATPTPSREAYAGRDSSSPASDFGSGRGAITVDRIERSDLAPLTAGDGSGTQYDPWAGLSAAELAKLAAHVVLPPRSPVLKAVWARLLDSRSTAAGNGADLFEAFRLDSLSRSGLGDRVIRGAGEASGAMGPGQVVLARAQLSEGRTQEACSTVRAFGQDMSHLPELLTREALMLRGACALIADDTAGAGLAASLLRDVGGDLPGLAALDAGRFPEPRAAEGPAEQWGVADLAAWLAAGGRADAVASDERALGDALVFLARNEKVDPASRLAAAEGAARRNILAPEGLAEVYLAVARNGAGGSPAAGRAAAYVRAAQEVTPFQKVRAIRGFLDASRQAGLYMHALAMMDGPVRSLQPVAELAWFAETAIEVALVAGDTARARDWIAGGLNADPAATGGLDHWAALAAILDAPDSTARARALGAVEEMALGGRFGADALHRLATVLDALDFHVPIPLWEAASRTPQPTGGFLPETGLLSRLQEASRSKRFAETVLLVIQTVGPGTASDANMLALGDAIRALKRAGLEKDARVLGFEALFAVWPRRTSG